MNMPLVSVVILTWNRVDDLLETVTEVKRSTYRNIEIIVVDNGSGDGTVETLGKRDPDVIILALKKNGGIAGYNEGMKHASGKYIVVLDNDSFPDRETIEKMVSCFEQDSKLGVAAFDVHNYNYRQCIRRPDPGPGVDAFGYNGAGAGIRKECLDSAGLLYEPFFLYLNEQDHALRILHHGYRIKLFPDLTAFHKQSPAGRSNEKMAYYYTRNLLWLVWRHYPALPMIMTTLNIFFYASLYTVRTMTTVYWRAVHDAISGVDAVFRTRSPVDEDIIRRARIPVNLAFTVYG